MLARELKSTLNSFKGLGKNVLANIYGQAVTIIGQLALIPILVYAWGVEGFGQWTLLFTLPSLLAYGDLGVGSIAGNAIGEAEAKGEVHRSLRAFKTGKVFSIVASFITFGVLFGLTVAASSYGLTIGLDSTTYLLATALLSASSSITLQYNFYISTLRGLGEWFSATITNNNFRLFETIALAFLATSFDEMYVAALGVLLARIATLVALSKKLKRYHHSSKNEKFSSELMISWLKPALSFSTMPISQLLLLNIPLLILGRISGSSTVAEYSICRTFSRIPLQATNIVGTAIAGPALREAAVSGVEKVTPKIIKLSSIVATGASVIALLLLGIHRCAFEVWTHSTITPNVTLLVLLFAATACSASWNIGSNYLAVINQHSKLYLAYFIISIMTLATINMWAKGMLSIAAALFAIEAIMAVCTAIQLKRISKFNQ